MACGSFAYVAKMELTGCEAPRRLAPFVTRAVYLKNKPIENKPGCSIMLAPIFYWVYNKTVTIEIQIFQNLLYFT